MIAAIKFTYIIKEIKIKEKVTGLLNIIFSHSIYSVTLLYYKLYIDAINNIDILSYRPP